MALEKQIWTSTLVENLFKNNEFMNFCQDHSGYVSFKTVHVPQAGASPSVTKNPTSFPLVAAQRTDQDFTYQIDGYATDSWFVTDIEAAQISYPKMQSIMYNANKILSETIADNLLYNWATTSTGITAIRTTGSGSTLYLAPSATGSRNTLSSSDIAKAKATFDAQNVPQADRKIVIDALLHQSLLEDPYVKQAYALGQVTMIDGNIKRLMGFDIIMRSTVITTSSANTVNTVGAAGATGDNLAAIAYHPDFVSKALGATDVFYQAGNPLYLGDVMSALVLFGGSVIRKDGKGVIVISQQ